jgi:GNAT superfamily N-acetyltransferase
MILTDHALARRLEAVEARIAMEYAQTQSRLFPHFGATFEVIAGGAAVFAGLNSPMTQAVGMGMNGSADMYTVDHLENFFRRQNSPVNIQLCPHADNSLRVELATRGYRLIEQTNTLARVLTPRDWNVTPFNGVLVRRAKPNEFDRLAKVIARGYMPEGEIVQSIIDVFTTFFNQATAVVFLAEVDGNLAGGGVVGIIDHAAALFATSVLPEFRGRGAQSALIQARLNFGIESGCDLAMVSAAPGGSSHRNLERQDFRIVYTRAKLFREFCNPPRNFLT